MAKRKVNKAQAIRDYAAANPGSRPKDIIAALAKKGITVGSTNVTLALKSGKSTGKRGRPATNGKSNLAFGFIDPKEVDYLTTAIIETKQLVGRIGLERLKAALQILEKTK